MGSSPRGMSPVLGSSASMMGSSANIPKFQHPSHSLLEENGFKQMKYAKWFKRCIEDRQKQGEEAELGRGVYRYGICGRNLD